MIGQIISSQQTDRSMNNLIGGGSIDDEKLIAIGQKKYAPYEKYCGELLNLERQKDNWSSEPIKYDYDSKHD